MIAITIDPDLVTSLIEAAGALLLLVVSVIVLPWLRKRAQADKTLTDRDRYEAVLDMIDAAVVPAVAATEQVVARKLRVAKPDPGHLNQDQADKALSEAMIRVYDHLDEGRIRQIRETMGIDRAKLDELLRTHIEAYVYRMKQQAQSADPDEAFE